MELNYHIYILDSILNEFLVGNLFFVIKLAKAQHHTMPRLRFQRMEQERTDLSIVCRGNGQAVSGQHKMFLFKTNICHRLYAKHPSSSFDVRGYSGFGVEDCTCIKCSIDGE